MGSNNIFTGKQPENKRLWGNNQSGMNLMKLKVRTCFKELHKVRKQVFAGDDHALQFIRQVIRNEFEKHKDVTDPQKIEELIKVGEEAAEYAKTHVVQLERQGDSDRFRMKLTPDHKLITNKMYDENEIIPPPRSRRRKKDSESCPSSTSDGTS